MNQQTSGNHLLYLAHGGPEFKNEALSSILSYIHLKRQTHTAQATILVYTDEAEYFQQILGAVPNIKYIELPVAQLRAWYGAINFVHRVKIELILHAVTNYGGNVLYLDSDTYFVQDELPLFEAMNRGQHIMHVQESVLSQSKVPLHQAMYLFLRTHPAPEWGSLSSSTVMYNAGVVGISKKDIPLLHKTLQLVDILYQQCPSHVVEQFAFSFHLQQARPVTEAISSVLHYWHMKDARQALNTFFNKTKGLPLNDLLREFEKVPVVAAAQTKFAWEARPRWQRGLARLVGQKWKWPN